MTKPTTMRAAFAGAEAARNAASASPPPAPRRWRLWLLAALVVALGLCTAVVLTLRHGLVMVITQADLQTRAERTFPVTQDCDGVVEVTYRDPVLALRDGHATLAVGFAGGVLKHDLLKGRLAVTAIPRYDPATGELYLEHAVLDGIRFERVPDQWLERYKGKLSAALAFWLDSHPIYILDYSSVKKAAARAVVRSLAVVGGTVRIELGW